MDQSPTLKSQEFHTFVAASQTGIIARHHTQLFWILIQFTKIFFMSSTQRLVTINIRRANPVESSWVSVVGVDIAQSPV